MTIQFLYIILLTGLLFGCAGSSLVHGLFSSRGEWGLLSVARPRLPTAVLLLLWSRGLGPVGFSSCGPWAQYCGSQALELGLSTCSTGAQLLQDMWDLPGPGIEPTSPKLAGGFFTTEPPGNPCDDYSSYPCYRSLRDCVNTCIDYLVISCNDPLRVYYDPLFQVSSEQAGKV